MDFRMYDDAFGGVSSAEAQQQRQLATIRLPSPLVCSSASSTIPCAICARPSTGSYFGVLACRACASFFRRSMLEHRQYICRNGNNCGIQTEGMRNSCRSCRLRKCIQAGMNTETNPVTQEKPSITNLISPHNVSTSQTEFHLNLAFDTSIANILKFSHSLKNFENAHKALVNVYFGKLDLQVGKQQELRSITLDDHIHLDRGKIMLQLQLLHEHFPLVEGLSNGLKVRILKHFHLPLCQLRDAEYTIQAFPGETNYTKYVLHPGCVLDRNNLDYFFSTIENVEEHKKLCIPLMDAIHGFIVNRYKPLAINHLEFAALTGILLYNCVDRVVPLPPEFVARRNQLYTELHAILAKRFGANAAAIASRFGQLLMLLQELGNLTYEMEELFTILKIFLPPPNAPTDIWDDLLNAKIGKMGDVESARQQQQLMKGTTSEFFIIVEGRKDSLGSLGTETSTGSSSVDLPEEKY